jgi:hypothetical protein
MSFEGIVGLSAVFAVVGLFLLALPPKPLPKIEVECPRCKAKNERRCPNCFNVLPKGSLTCSKCHIEAKNVPCSKCGADLRGMPIKAKA